MTACTFINDHGISTGNCLKYDAQDAACPTSENGCTWKWKGKLTIKGYVGGFPSSSADIKAYLCQGTLMIAIDACGQFMQLWYSCAVFIDTDGTKCNSANSGINHAVMLVGYGTLNGVPYFLLRNSWGTQWGCKGYLFIKDNGLNAPTPRNTCNLAMYPMYARFGSC